MKLRKGEWRRNEAGQVVCETCGQDFPYGEELLIAASNGDKKGKEISALYWLGNVFHARCVSAGNPTLDERKQDLVELAREDPKAAQALYEFMNGPLGFRIR